MPVKMNHTLVFCKDKMASTKFMTEMLGVAPAVALPPFMCVHLDNDVSLDFLQKEGPIASQHFAFLVSEAEFDAGFNRIKERGLRYWADPFKAKPGEINHNDGGRGVYFEDPDGHFLEFITKPYSIPGS